jgi:UDP-N-acetylglucosamine 4,6-dehydratase
VIEPAIHLFHRGDFRAAGGVPVADGFRYASDKNTDWLDAAGLQALLDEA